MIDPDNAVYWRRRAVAIAGVLGVVLLVVWAMSGPSAPSVQQIGPERNTAGSTQLSFEPPTPAGPESPSDQAGGTSLLPLPAALPNQPGASPSSTLPSGSALPAGSAPPSGSALPGSGFPAGSLPAAGAVPSAGSTPAAGSALPSGSALPTGSAMPGAAPASLPSGSALPALPALPSASDSPDRSSTSGIPGADKPGKAKSHSHGNDDALPGAAGPAVKPSLTPAAGAVPACSDKSIGLVAQVGASSYRSGQRPEFRLVIANIGSAPCTRDLDPGLQELMVSGPGGARVWDSNDCFPKRQPASHVLAPGKAMVFPVSWAGRTSAPGCGVNRKEVPPGSYQLTGKLGGLTSGSVPFTITPTPASPVRADLPQRVGQLPHR